MKSNDFISTLDDYLNKDEKLAVSILSIPTFITDEIANELLKLKALSNADKDIFTRIKNYPIWKKRSKNTWVLENDVRNSFLKKLNGSSQSTIKEVYEKLEDFKPNLIKTLDSIELKNFFIQLSRLSLSLPEKQEEGIQIFRKLYDISDTYKIHTTSELIYTYLDEDLKIDYQSKELPSYILSALFMKGMYAYNKRKNEIALKYLIPVWKNHDNSYLSLKDAGIASHIIGLIWSKEKYRFDEIKNAFDSSIKIRIEVGDQIGLAQTYHSLGNLYNKHKMLPEAEWAYYESLRLDKLNNNRHGLAQIYHSLGNLFSKFPIHYKASEDNYKKSIPILKSVPDEYGLAQVYCSLANLLSNNKDRYTEAESLYKESIEIGMRLGNVNNIKRHLAQVYMDYGIMEMNYEKLPEAITLLNNSLKYEKKPFYRAKILELIGKIEGNKNYP